MLHAGGAAGICGRHEDCGAFHSGLEWLQPLLLHSCHSLSSPPILYPPPPPHPPQRRPFFLPLLSADYSWGVGGALGAHGLILPSPIGTHRGLDQGHRGETSIQAPELHRLSMHGHLYSSRLARLGKTPTGSPFSPCGFPSRTLGKYEKG